MSDKVGGDTTGDEKKQSEASPESSQDELELDHSKFSVAGDNFYSFEGSRLGESRVSSDELEEPVSIPGRSLRNRQTLKRPSRLDDYVVDDQIDDYTADIALLMHELKSDAFGEVNLIVAEALVDKNCNKAMIDEFKSVSEMKTWE